MPEPLISLRAISKSHGQDPLFSDLDLIVHPDARLAIIGNNGTGKSTLLRILEGTVPVDSGERGQSQSAIISCVEQDPTFPAQASARSVLAHTLASMAGEADPAAFAADPRLTRMLADLQWADPDQAVDTLSGGWQKRLAIARALIQQPDVLLLDEPTNHLDLPGMLWLEALLDQCSCAVVMVSHDRWFLDACAGAILELGPGFPGGYFVAPGRYSEFLALRQSFLDGQREQQSSMANRMRREESWLARRPKARTTKSVSRIRDAENLRSSLQEVSQRNHQAHRGGPAIDFSSSNRKTTDLIVVEHVAKSYGNNHLFRDVSLTVSPGTRLGIVGSNGSGKSTLLKILAGTVSPDAGSVRHANQLSILTFDQHRSALDGQRTLRQVCCPSGGDTVTTAQGSLHIHAFAKKFRFSPLQLEQRVASLSGGEQARLLIATLIQQQADVLVLDEPTNDLDIATLEALEESLCSFAGGVVLITHDRYLLDRTCTALIALDGAGQAHRVSDYGQWEAVQARSNTAPATTTPQQSAETSPAPASLTHAERKELRSLQGRIEKAEQQLSDITAAMADPAVACDSEALIRLQGELEHAQGVVDQLYGRWQVLEERL